MKFLLCIYPCNHYPDQYIVHLLYLRRFSCTFPQSLPVDNPQTVAIILTSIITVLFRLLFLNSYINGVILYLHFYVWPFLFNIMPYNLPFKSYHSMYILQNWWKSIKQLPKNNLVTNQKKL